MAVETQKYVTRIAQSKIYILLWEYPWQITGHFVLCVLQFIMHQNSPTTL